MKRMLAVIAMMAACAGTVTAGPKINIDDKGDAWIQPSILGQLFYNYNKDAADPHDFYVRRARIILAGQVTDGVKVFMETDNDMAGKSGAGAISTDIQDAFVDFRLQKGESSEMWLAAGLILLPFSIENKSSAGSLLGLDYNGEVIKLANAFTWRDIGAELHGKSCRTMEYRLGVFDGYDTANSTKNPDAALRFTGHLSFNIFGQVANSGWFCNQNPLGNKDADGNIQSYLVLGAGLDNQNKATLVTDTNGVSSVTDNKAWVVDVQSGFAVKSAAVLVNAAYYNWDNASFDGNTAFIETGVLLCKNVMPTVKWSRQAPDGGKTANDFTVGVHYLLKGHNARIGAEYTWGDTKATDKQVLVGAQFLL